MSQYLEDIDKRFKSKPIKDWCIDELFFPYDKLDDPLSKIIFKYESNFHSLKYFKIEEQELEIILKEINKDYNILIICLLDYLIASSSLHNKSNLVNDCKFFIELYFNKTNDEDDGLLIYNFFIILKWTLSKFPKAKEGLKNKIKEKLLSEKKDYAKILFFLDCFLREEELCNFFTQEEYYEFYDKYFIEKTDINNSSSHLRLYEEYLSYLNKNKKYRKKFLKKYCDFVINNIDVISVRKKQILLRQVRDYLDELGDYNDDTYCLIDEHLEKANMEAKQSLQIFTMEIPKEVQELLNQGIELKIEQYRNLSNIGKVDLLLKEVIPLSFDDLKKKFTNYKNSFSSKLQTHFLDEKGAVINYKELTENEFFSLKSYEYINDRINIYFLYSVYPFFKSFIFDEAVSKYLKHILNNNKLITENRTNSLYIFFTNFLKQDFMNSVYNIVEELEESLRFYFKNKKMNIYRKNRSGDLIGLNDIFNDDEKNPYKKNLCEVINEDNYFTLKWLLVDKYGFKLRHKIAHRLDSQNLYNSQNAIYASIQILRLYWFFQKK